MNMEKFIASVYSKRCLWDLRVSAFYNKTMVREMWKIVEQECNLEAGTAIKRWKNLKDTFRREHRKVSTKWALYKDLIFLKAVMAPRIPTDGTEKAEYTIVFEHDNADSRESNSVEENLNEPQPKRHRNADPETVKVDNSKRAKTIERKSVSIDDDDDKSEDDDYHFLMSFRAYLKQMSDQKKLKFRIKMQELVYDIMYSNELPQTRNSSAYLPEYMNFTEGNTHTENMHDMHSILEYEDIKPVIND